MKIKIFAAILIIFAPFAFGSTKTDIISKAKSFLGVKYKYGGTTRISLFTHRQAQEKLLLLNCRNHFIKSVY